MPIYEFYCSKCHTIYNFFSTRVDTETRPGCPGCAQPALERCTSRFAVGKARKDGDAGAADGDPGLDQLSGAQLERVKGLLQREAAALEENYDPRQAGRLMRQLYETAGLDVPPGMSEAMRRLETGEDPEAIEAEFGAAIDAETMFDASALAKSGKARRSQPARDETLYDL